MIFQIVVLFGLVFTLAGSYVAYRGSKSRTWPVTIGTVLHAEVRREESRRHRGPTTVSYRPHVAYRYSVLGQEYQGNVFSMSGSAKLKAEDVQKLLHPYQKDTQVSVRYNPNNPKDAVLQAGISPNVIGAILAGIAMIVLGVAGILKGW